MAEKKALTLEESFVELDKMVDQLESPDISLEESFQVYKKGMELLKECNSKIDTVEKKMLQMNKNGELSEF
ncbi:MAG TPA: exodeoxyribonuclease VII small subunit [Candidatus Pelethocola excrementipullorum]|nr:exodeoxyribonuclease VII small subunit [Candidatus Pelethocola excrementipullorum]